MMKVQPSVYVYTHTLGDVQGSIQNYLASNQKGIKGADTTDEEQEQTTNNNRKLWYKCGVDK